MTPCYLSFSFFFDSPDEQMDVDQRGDFPSSLPLPERAQVPPTGYGESREPPPFPLCFSLFRHQIVMKNGRCSFPSLLAEGGVMLLSLG